MKRIENGMAAMFRLRSQILDSASSPRIAASPKARHVYVLWLARGSTAADFADYIILMPQAYMIVLGIFNSP